MLSSSFVVTLVSVIFSKNGLDWDLPSGATQSGCFGPKLNAELITIDVIDVQTDEQ